MTLSILTVYPLNRYKSVPQNLWHYRWTSIHL